MSMCTGACVEAKDKHWVSPIAPHLEFFLRHSLSQNWKPIDSAMLAGHWAPGILLCPQPQHWNYRCVLPYLSFLWGPQIWTLALMLPEQALYVWAISPVWKSHFPIRCFSVCLDGITTEQCISRTNTNASRWFSPNHLFLGHKYEVSVPNTK